jgi:hypothetical protein
MKKRTRNKITFKGYIFKDMTLEEVVGWNDPDGTEPFLGLSIAKYPKKKKQCEEGEWPNQKVKVTVEKVK